ncbi:MAG: Insulinase family protein [Ignavibacteria bacterium]|nr:Insulinase family protein [Ignavibacteria bacterium]
MMQPFRKKALYIAFAIMILIFGHNSLFAQFIPISFMLDSLENGLQIIYCVDKTAPVVATVLHYKVGSRDEKQDKNGYAHFFEHLMFEATDNIPRASIPKYAQEAGGELNAHTSFDETVFQFQLPSNQIKLALWIESQRMRKLHIDSIGVATQKGVVSEEKKQGVDNAPYGTAWEKIFQNAFPGSSYSWFITGSLEHIAKAEISDFKEFYDNYYQPNNAVLCICGDFDPGDVRNWIRDYFGIYPRGKEPLRNPFILQPMTKEYREKIEDEKAQLPAVFIGYRGVKIGDPDYYPLTLLTQILAKGESSRMYQRLVDDDQIAEMVNVEPYDLQYSGLMFLISIVAPGKAPELVEKTMYAEIDSLVKNGISDEELQKAKNLTEADFIADKKGVLDKALTLAFLFAYYGNANLINTEIEMYNKVTKEEIIAVAKKYLATDKRVVLTYIPKQ